MKTKDKEKLAEKLFMLGEENIHDDGEGTADERADKVINKTAGVCAVAAICPIPFADILILTPIQCVMALKIGKIYGFEISKEEASKVVIEIGGVVGLGWLAQQVAIGLYKTILPFLGAITTMPLVWSLTYAIGHIVKKYYEYKKEGKVLSADEIKMVFEKMKEEGKTMAKEVDLEKMKADVKKWWDGNKAA